MLSRMRATQPRGIPLLVAGIKLRDNLSFKQRIETFSFSCVPGRIIPMFAPISDRPAYFRGIRLRPPAIEFRKIQPAIHQHLHAACAACFPRPSRSVYPDVHALNQMLRHENVVVGKEDYPGSNFRAASKLKPLPDHLLALGVLGMRLACKHELNRALSIRQDVEQAAPDHAGEGSVVCMWRSDGQIPKSKYCHRVSVLPARALPTMLPELLIGGQ